MSSRNPSPRSRTARRRPARLFPAAVLFAALVHALVLSFVRVAVAPRSGATDVLVVVPRPVEIPERARPRPPARGPAWADPRSRADLATRPAVAGPAGAPPAAAPSAAAEPPVSIPTVSPKAPLDRTIPPTALRGMRAAVLPLVASSEGIGRRELLPAPRRVAIARAESLLTARLADLPGVRREPRGAVGVAGGGVTLAIPWAGFLPADRKDDRWREERCQGGRSSADDKPGEAEARRSQCS